MTATLARKPASGARALIGLSCLIAALTAVPGPRLIDGLAQGGAAAFEVVVARVGDLSAWVSERLRRMSPPLVATSSAGDVVLAGEYEPLDDRTREVAGLTTFLGAEIRLETGGALKTRPHRIMSGEATLVRGATYAQALDLPADAQVEVREVVSGAAPGPCGGASVGWLALVQTGDTVRILPVRGRTPPGETLDPAAPCPILSLKKR